MLTPKQRTHGFTTLALLIAVAGCGQFRMPKAATPDELPKRARVLAPAPEFVARAQDLTLYTSRDLVGGKPVVFIGVDWDYAAEADEWAAALEHRFGKSGERYRIVKLLEDGRMGVLDQLTAIAESEVDFLVSPDFASSFGFESRDVPSEGPHVAVLSADGVLLGTTDGLARSQHIEKISFALQGVLTPLAR